MDDLESSLQPPDQETSDPYVPDWDFARNVFEVQIRQAERSVGVAQTLLTAVALLAAFGGPVLLTETNNKTLDVVSGIIMLPYLITLGFATKRSLEVIYSNKTFTSRAIKSCIYYKEIATYHSERTYAEALRSLSDHDQFVDIADQIWSLATLNVSKARTVRSAVRAVQYAMFTFGLLLSVKYLGMLL